MREKEFLPLVESKLGIKELNDMQKAMLAATPEATRGIMLLAPTGSGKTLAFALPLLKQLNPPSGRLQALIMAPGRELVLQIADILRKLAPAYRLVALYGGHSVADEVNSLSVAPDIVVATPGRLLDHIKRRNIDVMPCRIVVLDEYDKSLSLGFEQEMKRIFSHLKNVSRIILPSATDAPSLPDFVPVSNPLRLDYMADAGELKQRAPVHIVESDEADKLASLHKLLKHLAGGEEGIGRTAVFVNHRDSAERVHNWLAKRGASSVLYHGALDQTGREKALALFRAGSKPILVTTDLGARGLDVEGVDNVVHYHLPPTPEDWTHRHGRTARGCKTGNVY
ncbi:MAG: DEAD/DEAH box helicase, partial [Muribaculaceae bacterium]|nr:DEAD/DEAH box helicase [Muribaculaceae bacterium]